MAQCCTAQQRSHTCAGVCILTPSAPVASSAGLVAADEERVAAPDVLGVCKPAVGGGGEGARVSQGSACGLWMAGVVAAVGRPSPQMATAGGGGGAAPTLPAGGGGAEGGGSGVLYPNDRGAGGGGGGGGGGVLDPGSNGGGGAGGDFLGPGRASVGVTADPGDMLDGGGGGGGGVLKPANGRRHRSTACFAEAMPLVNPSS